MLAPILVCMITLNSDNAVQVMYVLRVRVGEPASRAFITLYGYGAKRIRKRSFGRFSIARTTRLREAVWERHLFIDVRK